MKKIVSAVLVCILLLSTVFALASCGKILNGTYQSEEIANSYTTFEFEGNKVTLKLTVLGFTNEGIEGTYSIEDGKITFDFGDEKDADDYSEPMDFSEGNDGGTPFIKIGGVQYNKK